MNRQGMLDHFVKTVNGKGRSIKNEFCRYVRKGHPGCAIGCQPEFQKWVADNQIDVANIERKTIGHVMSDFPTVGPALGVENDSDKDFLTVLQDFHDFRNNWDGDSLLPEAVEKFCSMYKLTNPLERN